MNIKKDFTFLVNHLKDKGFVFQGSQIYGGLANTWDYGPLGVLLKEKIKNVWRKHFILQEENNFEIDSKILMNPQVWKASGHLDSFADYLIENKVNGKRYRLDKLIEEFSEQEIKTEKMSLEQMEKYVKDNIFSWENQKTSWTNAKQFNLMFKTFQGVVEDNKDVIYLRPETAQGIFVNFKNVSRSMRSKLPFGIGQIGKSFRNEVTPGNFIFRTREFEQMELEVFCSPQDEETIYQKYLQKCQDFLLDLGIKEESFTFRNHEKEELAHYSKATCDVEFEFPFGWGELLGVANRGNYDLTQHSSFSNEKLDYLDPETNEKFIPSVIEPSIGLDRLMLAILVDALEIENPNSKEERIVLKLDSKIAPYQFAILPLNKKVHGQVAKKIFKKLLDQNFLVTYDQTGSIGKRYRRQDSIGTPFCLTVIDQSEKENLVTIRFRDSMKQETINLDDLHEYLR